MQSVILTGKPWERAAPHAPGRLMSGPVLITSGITARAPDGGLVAPNDMLGQCRQVVSNLTDIMVAAGTDATRILKLCVFVTSIDDFMTAKNIWQPLYVGRPASTLVEVKRLQLREMVVEIEAIVELMP